MFEHIKESIINGEEQSAVDGVAALLADGKDPQEILREGLVAGMNVVGERFRKYDMWLPEVVQAAKAMKAASALLKPHLDPSGGGTKLGTIIVATVEGDVHDIGKNLVSMMLDAAGFDVKDLGVDVKIGAIAQSSVDEKADVVGLSALLTTTMLAMKPAIEAIKAASNRTKVMIGGSPITKQYADEVGADGFAPDALRAINLAKELIGKE